MESDLKLIERANKGSIDAFEALYFRYRDWVYNLAWRFTHDRDLAKDILQETFLYLLRKIPHLKLEAKMITFLYPVVKNLSIRLQSKRRRFLSSQQGNDEELVSAPQNVTEDTAQLAQVFSSLPDEQKEVVLLRFVDDMALNEIARAIQSPIGTVKSRLHNALKSLRSNPKCKRYFFE